MPERIVIVGGGQAGAACAQALRAGGFSGSVAIVAAEAHLPYERPPLSKGILAGDCDDASATLFAEPWYAGHDVSLHRNQEAVRIDLAARQVVDAEGRRYRYDALVLATGARARTLPALGRSDRVFTLRTLDDAMRLRDALRPGRDVVIVGGGFIGLEVASTATARGARCTVVEAAPTLMSRVVPPEVAARFVRLHRDHGVDVRLGATVRSVVDGRVELGDGSGVDADAIVIGIGIAPNEQLAAEAGIAVADGILVDAYGRTDVPGVWAAGDCARLVHPGLDRPVRLESWEHATAHAEAVARNLMGANEAYDLVPWAWSDQHGVNLQVAGAPASWDRVVVRGDLDAGPATLFQLERGTLVGVITIDQPRDMRIGRQWLATRPVLDPERLADRSIPLKAQLAAHAAG